MALIALVLSAAVGVPTSAPESRPQIAVMPVQRESSAADLPELVNDYVLIAVQEAGYPNVIGHTDVAALLGFEKEKELAGCNDVACFSEIGGALGTEWLVVVKVAKVETDWAVTATLIDTGEVRVLNRTSEFVAGGPKQLLGALKGIATHLLRHENPTVQPTIDRAKSSEPPPEADANGGPYASLGSAARTQDNTGIASYMEVGYRFDSGLEIGLAGTWPVSIAPQLRWLAFENISGAIELGVSAAASILDASVGVGASVGAGWHFNFGRVGVRLDVSVFYDLDLDTTYDSAPGSAFVPVVLRAYYVVN